MEAELSARLRIPYELVKLGRELMKNVVSLSVSMEKPWSVNQQVISASLRQAVSGSSSAKDLHSTAMV